MNQRPDVTVFVIDDDDSIRRALDRKLRSLGLGVEAFASAEDFLRRPPATSIGCIVTDLRMPGMSGLELQDALARSGCRLPLVFITGHGDVPASVRAMKGGAVNFLLKPFAERELLEAVDEALARSRQLESDRAEDEALRGRWRCLTERERQVMALVARGLLNKQIAAELGAAEATVKIHRGRVMEKMRAASLAELVRMNARLGREGDGPGASSAP